MFKKCGHCDFRTLNIDDFITHFQNAHYNDIIKIRIPLYDIGNKRKYALMNYQILLCDFSKECKIGLGKAHNAHVELQNCQCNNISCG